MKKPLALMILFAAGLLTGGANAQVTTNTIQLSPAEQNRLLPANRLPMKTPPALPPIVSLTSATLSIANSPLDAWCRNNANGTASGRVFIGVRFARPADLRSAYANLVVNTGAGEVRHRFLLGSGEFSSGTAPLSFPAREICTDHCVGVRLEPEGTPSGYSVNTATRQACI